MNDNATDFDYRRLQAKLHRLFDPIYMELRFLTRVQAFEWLARQLDIPLEKCTINLLSIEQLKQACDMMKAHKAEGYAFFERRKEKKRKVNREQRRHVKSATIQRKFDGRPKPRRIQPAEFAFDDGSNYESY